MKSWMTSLGGILTAAGAAMAASTDPTVKVIGQILTIIGPVIFGLSAKDFNVTGGTKEQ